MLQRVTDSHDYSVGSYLIIEHDDIFHLAEVNAVDQNREINVSAFSPPLPAKRFSLSRSTPIQISAVNIIAKIVDSPRKTKTNRILLSDEVFLSIQDLLDEFQNDF